MTDWLSCELGDVITFQRGYDLPNQHRIKGKYPIVSSNGISDYHNEFKVKAPGVVTGRYGTIGEVFYLNEDFWPLNTSLFVKDFKNNNPRFISYFLQCIDLKNYNVAGAVPGINRNHLHKLKIKFPPLTIQKRIAEILTAYDDLIENNLKRIKLLEELAQRTYEEWFVRFRVNGEPLAIDESTGLPVGWEKVRADELFNINIGKTPPRDQAEWFTIDGNGIKWISIKDMNNSGVYIFETSEKITHDGVDKFNIKVIPENTVILSFKLTVGKVSITTESMLSNEAIAHFNLRKDFEFKSSYVYCYLKNFNYDILGSTSAIGTALNSKVVKAIPFIVPTNRVLNMFQEYCEPIFQQMLNLLKANNKLKESRDILLPRLMNGTINVNPTS